MGQAHLWMAQMWLSILARSLGAGTYVAIDGCYCRTLTVTTQPCMFYPSTITSLPSVRGD